MATATQVKRVLVQLSADDGDAEAKIDKIAAKAEELSKLHPELEARISTAAASAKLKVLRDEIYSTLKPPEPMVPEIDTAEPDMKLIGLKSDLEELERRAERALILKADDTDARAKVMRIRAQLASLGELTEQPEISVAGLAKANAEIAGIVATLDKLGREKVEPKVEPKVDIPAAVTAGAEAATAVNRGFRLRMSPLAAGWTSLIVGGMAALPAAAAATGALMAGALGAKLLIGTKAVQGPLYKQFHDLMATLTSVMRVAALPLVKPLADAFAQVGAWAKQMEPLISRAFASVGPLIQPLASALEGLVSGVLPGFIALMRAAQPAVSAVAGVLGTLSRAVGGILSGLAPAVRASSGVLGSLARVVSLLAPVATSLAGSLATALAPALRSVASVVQILAPVLSRVGGILAGLVGSALQLVSRALAAVLPYAARMVAVMADGLMPILSPLVSALSQVAGALSGQLARSLAMVMPGVEKLASDYLVQLQKILVPLLPSVVQLAGDFIQLSQGAVIPLLPPVLQLADMLMRLTTAVIVPMMPAVERLTGLVVSLANAAVTAMNLLSHIPGLGGLGGGGGAGMSLGGYAGGQEGGGNAGEGGSEGASAGYSAGLAAGSAYGGAWADGATTAAKKAARARAAAHKLTPADFALILAGGAGAALTGTAAQVRAGVGKLIAAITQDEKAGVLSQSQGSALTLWLDKDSARLQALATRRVSVMREIAAAQKYAASVATNIRQADGLTSAAAGGWNGGPQTTGQIISNLRLDVGNIRKFAQNIARLRKLGLNRDYLAQLIQMGPDAGGQLAEQLANSGLGDIRQINAAESQITQVSGYLGKTAANAMYDSGAMAGKGFLSGLEAQQAAITKMMQKIAKSMIDTLRHELGIHSPSTVTRDLARMTGAGIPLGLDDSLTSVRASARRLAGAMVPRPGIAGGGAHGAAGGPLQVEWVGGHQADQQFLTWIKKNIRIRGGNPAVTGA
jgi:hypothetical protein